MPYIPPARERRPSLTRDQPTVQRRQSTEPLLSDLLSAPAFTPAAIPYASTSTAVQPEFFDVRPARTASVDSAAGTKRSLTPTSAERHVRVKKVKVKHTFSSLSAAYYNAWTDSSTSLQGKPTRMAPLASHWTGDSTAWSATDEMYEKFMNLCVHASGDPVPRSTSTPSKRSSLPVTSPVLRQGTRMRSNSAPPSLDAPYGSTLAALETSPAATASLKAQLLSILRSRMGGSSGGVKKGEAALKLRKWVFYNGKISYCFPFPLD